MSECPPRCACGHHHLTTRGPCTHWEVCGCREWRHDPDPLEVVYGRQRVLMEAVDSMRGTWRRTTVARALRAADVADSEVAL